MLQDGQRQAISTPTTETARRQHPLEVGRAGTSLLEVESVTRILGGIRAVDSCSLRVSEHSITGIIGPNGAGKSTLFDLITGFQRPDAGRIVFRGRRIDGLPPHEIVRRGIARTFQVPRELQRTTVLEALMLAAPNQLGEQPWAPLLVPGRVRAQELELAERAHEVLRFVELDHLAAAFVSELSVGQKKLLELARTLMLQASLVLLDEPGAGVNPALLRRLGEAIRTLRAAHGVTFLIIEHDMDLIVRLCDHVYVLSSGQTIAEGPPAEVLRHPAVLASYLGGQPR
jgi:branched-chain amino acid transport system ATP-binding protein